MTDNTDVSAAGVTAAQTDFVLPFQLENAGARGRLIRADGMVNTILSQHGYPEAVSSLLGEAVTLTALLGAALKIDGRLILQTSSSGPVTTLVAQYLSSGDVRGYASFEENTLPPVNGAQPDLGAMLGEGHLAMTIDPGAGMERYQGVVSLEGATLSEAAHLYFKQSEQIPTFIRIAVARSYTAGAAGQKGEWSWRAGGLLVQKLTGEGGIEMRPSDDNLDWSVGGDSEDWARASMLAATVEDHELLDPDLTPERLLYRLFHEEGVRAFPPSAVQAKCSCSRERVADMLSGFTREEMVEMAENGRIEVRCEFCNRHYEFDPATVRSASDEAAE